MLTIDGAYGEGGGQILRYATALSMLTNTPFQISNIRANRTTPGIRPQHYAAISILGALSNATVNGNIVGSQKLTFTPRAIIPGSHSFDIGTAGSMTLVYQACLLGVYGTSQPITIKLTGGSDVRWSPSWDYFKHHFLSILKKMGYPTTSQLTQRGYYPKGGGKATLTIQPTTSLQPILLDKKPKYSTIFGIIHISQLPEHIAQRMKHAVKKYAVKHDLQIKISIQSNILSTTPGTGITLWTHADTGYLAVSYPGEKGIRAEEIGTTAIQDLHQQIIKTATIDNHLFDQVLPYMALIDQPSICRIPSISSHAKTSMWLLQQFFNIDYEITAEDNYIQIKVNKNTTLKNK